MHGNLRTQLEGQIDGERNAFGEASRSQRMKQVVLSALSKNKYRSTIVLAVMILIVYVMMHGGTVTNTVSTQMTGQGTNKCNCTMQDAEALRNELNAMTAKYDALLFQQQQIAQLQEELKQLNLKYDNSMHDADEPQPKDRRFQKVWKVLNQYLDISSQSSDVPVPVASNDDEKEVTENKKPKRKFGARVKDKWNSAKEKIGNKFNDKK